MDELQALIKELRELIAQLKATPAAVTQPVVVSNPMDDTGYPKVVNFKGANFMLYRPINPKWEPSSYAKIFGKNGQVLEDPSLKSTPDGYPSRSPAGYPLVYNFVKDKVPYRPAVIIFGEQTFPDDAAVEAYIKATTPTAEEIERARKDWEEYDRKLKERAANANSDPGTTSTSTPDRRHGGVVEPPPTTDGSYEV
jgi:hypothetical protein